ncbi:Protein tyrosine kinase [Nesidiocoris tenuis]|uniref:non-specific serine/threonine protein kinase n=1 Tax=Nesidiocoris tenuis TaxID=355587 RepID=A0ABN7AZ36_9HEMI|nr:Protein tyrosine kinase [Nesidiocoris tenuis]
MEKYQVINAIGEGSFGRVFKAKRKVDHTIVAIKLISKYGRSQRELSTLRKECEIQRNLEHPNIIRMLDAFETDNEIGVVTEFAYQDLNVVLAKAGFLKEERASQIICDLVSALHYLHSHRVLHRDLKPQNVLLGDNNVAKLCDFGFARSMSRGTHVLTSIKGTPLYMAPELMEESAYDHNADLWSLGCIAYEMVVGSPPFTTTSILHLVQMIRHEKIKWPTHVSLNFQNLLKGLLHKDPTKRLSWPDLLHHPFVEGKVLITGNEGNGLTAELTESQALSKENQKKLAKKASKKHTDRGAVQRTSYEADGANMGKEPVNLVDLQNHMQLYKYLDKMSISQSSELYYDGSQLEDELKEAMNCKESENVSIVEADEWLAFLRRSMEELLDGDHESVIEPTFLNMVCRALSIKFPEVIQFTAALLSLPFSLEDITTENLAKIKKVYVDINLISKLVYASKLIISRPDDDNNLSAGQVEALENIFLLITYLVHSDDSALKQLCSLTNALSLPSLFVRIIELRNRNENLASHSVAILSQLLRRLPEYSAVVEDVVKGFHNPEAEIRSMMSTSNETLCGRVLTLVMLMSKTCPSTLMSFSSKKLAKDIDNLCMWPQGDLASEARKVQKEIHALSKSKLSGEKEE